LFQCQRLVDDSELSVLELVDDDELEVLELVDEMLDVPK
jgi:hypothetical protein